MMEETFYMIKSRKLLVGITLLFVAFIPSGCLYIALQKEESYGQIISSLGLMNIPFAILMISGVYFILKRKIPMMRLEKNKFYYNNSILKENYKDGIFFLLFPYCFRKLHTYYTYYEEITKVEQKSSGIYITKKKASLFSLNPALLQTGSFSRTDQQRILDRLNQSIHGERSIVS